ncbi:WD40-repeat-containing domain protein [Mycena sp. CBHHK59/15]|nr:WD40-repeat-containing domain protein [Mycena sp. CBHHK59/15]
MSFFPHSELLFGTSSTVVISGPHIHLADSRTGDLIVTTADRQGADREALLKSGPIRLAAIDNSGRHLVTSGEDKRLKLWQIDGLKLLNERELPKKPTSLVFTKNGQTILASDKFGDVFRYDLHPAPQSAEQKKAALASHDNPQAESSYWVMHHRDEHIRVSWYPQGYTIETYCLGHEKFVSAIHVPEFAPKKLVSGGGDPILKIWDWVSGTVTREIPILHEVEPFIKVKSVRRKRFEDDEEEGGDGNKKKGRKAKFRARKKEASTSAISNEEEPEAATPAEVTEAGEVILTLRKIESLKSDTDDRHLIFSAVGATALFSCPYSEDDAVPNIHAFDFEKPIIDFKIADGGLIWVCLDAQWSETSSGDATNGAPSMVRVVRLSGGNFVEVSDESVTPLLTALNSKCLLPATAADLKTLDLYLPLSALPKNHEVEHDPMDRVPADNPPDGGPTKEISRKELGRLKSKQAVLAKVQATARPAGEADLEERNHKRARSEHDEGSTDVVMDGVS